MPVVDWVAGGVAGTSQAVIGHPFDTVKTRMQTNAKNRSAISCASAIARSEGVLALWKGLTPALVSLVSTSSVRFGVQAHANSEFARCLGYSDFTQLSLGMRACSEAVGGFAAGIVLPIFVTPMELLKVRQQVHTGRSAPGFWAIARDVVRTQGVRGMYVGHTMTVLRSTLGNAALFGPYILAKDAAARVFGPDSSLVRPVAGVTAGWSSWFVIFPIDAAKSRMQTAGTREAGGMVDLRRSGPLAALAQLWREGALYRGLGPVLVRSVPVHIAYLPVFDLVAGWLSDRKGDD